jgi:hypothetical protein
MPSDGRHDSGHTSRDRGGGDGSSDGGYCD